MKELGSKFINFIVSLSARFITTKLITLITSPMYVPYKLSVPFFLAIYFGKLKIMITFVFL